jgi:flotillin
VKPAQAEGEKVRILARADAEAMEIQAAAAASNNRVALDQLIIEQLPQIVQEAARGLSGANVNIINGADGLGEMAAGLVGQGLAIFDSVKRGLAAADAKEKSPDVPPRDQIGGGTSA